MSPGHLWYIRTPGRIYNRYYPPYTDYDHYYIRPSYYKKHFKNGYHPPHFKDGYGQWHPNRGCRGGPRRQNISHYTARKQTQRNNTATSKHITRHQKFRREPNTYRHISKHTLDSQQNVNTGDKLVVSGGPDSTKPSNTLENYSDSASNASNDSSGGVKRDIDGAERQSNSSNNDSGTRQKYFRYKHDDSCSDHSQ